MQESFGEKLVATKVANMCRGRRRTFCKYAEGRVAILEMLFHDLREAARFNRLGSRRRTPTSIWYGWSWFTQLGKLVSAMAWLAVRLDAQHLRSRTPRRLIRGGAAVSLLAGD